MKIEEKCRSHAVLPEMELSIYACVAFFLSPFPSPNASSVRQVWPYHLQVIPSLPTLPGKFLPRLFPTFSPQFSARHSPLLTVLED